MKNETRKAYDAVIRDINSNLFFWPIILGLFIYDVYYRDIISNIIFYSLIILLGLYISIKDYQRIRNKKDKSNIFWNFFFIFWGIFMYSFILALISGLTSLLLGWPIASLKLF